MKFHEIFPKSIIRQSLTWWSEAYTSTPTHLCTYTHKRISDSMLRLLPGPPDGLDEISLCDLFAAREVARSDLRVNFDA